MRNQFITVPAPERFWSHVRFTDTCWLWTGALNDRGYGVHFTIASKPKRTASPHRYAYEFCVGPIPEGLEIDHLCRVRNCVNPDHLEAVTHRVNSLRGEAFSAKNARKTHCPRGHEYDYIIPSSGSRSCKRCMAMAMERFKARRSREACGQVLRS